MIVAIVYKVVPSKDHIGKCSKEESNDNVMRQIVGMRKPIYCQYEPRKY